MTFMIDPITYSLRAGSSNSDGYYRAIAAFADDWLGCARARVGGSVDGFQTYRRSAGLAERSFAEVAFEMLVLGVLLRVHGAEAVRLPGWKVRLLGSLVEWQGQLPWAEEVIKRARGWLGSIDVWECVSNAKDDDVSHLIDWLRSHDREAQADRLAEWQAYLQSARPELAKEIAAQCLALAGHFADESVVALGLYTKGVERFLAEVAPTYRGRYDAEMVSQSRLEYHLGMLGTEILNRAYRERFATTKHKIVIVPPCMRAQPEDKCKAVQTTLGAKCGACTPGCRVHQITLLGKKLGIDVFIIPDDLGRFGEGGGGVADGIGVVGVACVLTNWNGGWQTGAMGIPAQGLLLDYVGCSYHWHHEGIPTDINLRKLRAVVEGHRTNT
jgi:hypothetical protein